MNIKTDTLSDNCGALSNWFETDMFIVSTEDKSQVLLLCVKHYPDMILQKRISLSTNERCRIKLWTFLYNYNTNMRFVDLEDHFYAGYGGMDPDFTFTRGKLSEFIREAAELVRQNETRQFGPKQQLSAARAALKIGRQASKNLNLQFNFGFWRL